MAARDVPDGVGHRQHREPEGQRDTRESDVQTRKCSRQPALPQPPKTSQKVPIDSVTDRLESDMF